MPIRIPTPTYTVDVGPDARQIVNEAAESMEDWIKTSVEGLRKQTTDELQQIKGELEQEIDKLQNEYDESLEADRLKIEGFDQRLEDLKATLPTADQEKIQQVRDYLKEREERWKKLGANAVKVAKSAAKKVGGLPI